MAGAGAAGAAAVVPGLARPGQASAAGIGQAKQKIVLRGRAIAAAPPRGSRLVVAHAGRRTIAIVTRGRRRVVDVGGEPLDVAVSPGGRIAAVTTASWDKPGLVIVDLRRASVRARIDVGPAPCCVTFTADGKRIAVSGGEQEGTLHVVDAKKLAVARKTALGICPRGVAAAPKGDAVWVAVSGADRVMRVSTRSGKVGRRLRTARLPERVSPSPDGKRLLVTHGGRGSKRVSELDVASRKLKRRHLVGRQPSAVAWGPSGRRLIAVAGTGEVVAIARNGKRKRYRLGGQPRDIAVAGGRAWVVDSLTDTIDRVKA